MKERNALLILAIAIACIGLWAISPLIKDPHFQPIEKTEKMQPLPSH